MTSRIFQHKQNLLTLHTQKGRGNIKLYLLTAWIIKYFISCWFSEDNFLHNEYICRKYLPWCHIKRMSLCHIFKILRPKFQKTLATSVLVTIIICIMKTSCEINVLIHTSCMLYKKTMSLWRSWEAQHSVSFINMIQVYEYGWRIY